MCSICDAGVPAKLTTSFYALVIDTIPPSKNRSRRVQKKLEKRAWANAKKVQISNVELPKLVDNNMQANFYAGTLGLKSFTTIFEGEVDYHRSKELRESANG